MFCLHFFSSSSSSSFFVTTLTIVITIITVNVLIVTDVEVTLMVCGEGVCRISVCCGSGGGGGGVCSAAGWLEVPHSHTLSSLFTPVISFSLASHYFFHSFHSSSSPAS
ncbi:hypothetical protein E2C01_017621 [Portunus trituberculatus]|uniref:Uncharacterized protein n=1 Tax=Portunus trituberculatus TaxID=210409 RepID=A0A5B7DT11_PORTR|nr:hypothetical protein [Portunus trituberculatus]